MPNSLHPTPSHFQPEQYIFCRKPPAGMSLCEQLLWKKTRSNCLHILLNISGVHVWKQLQMAYFTPLSNHLSSLSGMYLLVSKKKSPLSLQCRWITKSWPEVHVLLCYPICLWSGYVLSPPFCTGIHILRLFGCFIPGMKQFLSEVVAVIEVQRDVVRFSDTPAAYGMEIFWLLFFFFFFSPRFFSWLDKSSVFVWSAFFYAFISLFFSLTISRGMLSPALW